ncbi:unnamed protein product [Zymoseptoria tritici ST99CH_1A5]|uniref:Secreted protein n=3 Tax=Zymoseptoria tritici TaxID=1047171 RepID=A0A1X7S2R4_ZYMT9|nr:unnamed protein product [Zymoseptoria tritici ST99CH_3D7]SMR58425.1 unnamed protein product [Zymoseptoria tritici ST99CH_1E4]SMR61406.1 unnamed protein product [Zymoseptoria tritici ST99CH_3D1]SMY27626.1 unnamed protein product [Zymoseptoria tritici ST99CH_1A5]
MKAYTIITALAIGVTSVAATCYKSGDFWPNKEEARAFVHDACYNQGGMFTGGWAPLQTKSMCPHAKSNNLGLLFEIENQNTREGFDLKDDDCYNRLTDEIFACEHGGDSSVAGWRVRADPGNC